MNYNEMTAAQCADWLAERDGCWYSIDREIGPIGWFDKDGKLIGDHPYHLTLDAAAKALREPWRLDHVDLWPGNVIAHIVRDHCGSKKQVVGPDELTARYRAAVAAAMEDDK